MCVIVHVLVYVIVWVHRWVPRGKRCSSSCWSDTRRPLRCSVLQRSEIGKGEEGAIRGLRERHAHTHTHTRTHTLAHNHTHAHTHSLLAGWRHCIGIGAAVATKSGAGASARVVCQTSPGRYGRLSGGESRSRWGDGWRVAGRREGVLVCFFASSSLASLCPLQRATFFFFIDGSTTAHFAAWVGDVTALLTIARQKPKLLNKQVEP